MQGVITIGHSLRMDFLNITLSAEYMKLICVANALVTFLRSSQNLI